MPEIIPNVHPIFVHFTVALLTISVGLFLILLLLQGRLPTTLYTQLHTVARWNLWFGTAITLITGVAGLYAYNTVAHDTPSHIAMTDHRNWAIATIIVFTGLASWSITRTRSLKPHGRTFVFVMLVAGGILMSTAWHGGEVVYRYGIGVMSLPKAEGNGHNHAHGDTAPDNGSASLSTMQNGHDNDIESTTKIDNHSHDH